MKLHENQDLFVEAVRATAQRYSIRAVYIEKDYWVTYSLKNVFTSPVKEKVVFKGGTSLSKVYGIIDRFSEDVDLALLPEKGRTNAGTKKCLRNITNIAGSGLVEDANTAGTEKHTKIRKVYYKYPRLADGDLFGQVGQRLLIEANAFSRPQPSADYEIQSYLTEFLKEREEHSIISDYALKSFPVKVLSPEKTLTEKIFSLIKASFQDHPIDSLRSKIRHIYDVHQLLQMQGMKARVNTKDFLNLMMFTLKDDSSGPVGKKDWIKRPFVEAEIFCAPQKVWPNIAYVYKTDFKDMMFGPLPSEKLILTSLEVLGEIVIEFDKFR